MIKIRKEDKLVKAKKEEKEISNKYIFKKLIKYTIPFVIL